jgi:transposase-like protein
MGQRRKLSAEYKREAVAMLESPGVAVHQIAAELGIGATVFGRWRRELRQESAQAFRGNGRPRDEDWPFCGGSGKPPGRLQHERRG